jgi:hypothetical protein
MPIRTRSRPTGRTPDGLFSAAQSARGKQVFSAQQCSLCHGENMMGSAGVPALADAGFPRAPRSQKVCFRVTEPRDSAIAAARIGSAAQAVSSSIHVGA